MNIFNNQNVYKNNCRTSSTYSTWRLASINSIWRLAFSHPLHQARTSLFAYNDQLSTDASADQICLIIPPRPLSDQWLLIRNLSGINQSPPSSDHHRLSERRKHSDANLSFPTKSWVKRRREFWPSHQREPWVVIGEARDLVGASDKRVDLHTISGRPIQILLLTIWIRTPNWSRAETCAGFYSPESANKHQLLVISLNDTPARALWKKSIFLSAVGRVNWPAVVYGWNGI